MEQMRISSYFGGLTLYEVMISITSVGIILGLRTVYLLPFIDRSEIVNTADQFKDIFRYAKWLVLTKRKFLRIKSDSGILMIQKKMTVAIKQFHRKINRNESFSFQPTVLYSVHSGPHPEAL